MRSADTRGTPKGCLPDTALSPLSRHVASVLPRLPDLCPHAVHCATLAATSFSSIVPRLCRRSFPRNGALTVSPIRSLSAKWHIDRPPNPRNIALYGFPLCPEWRFGEFSYARNCGLDSFPMREMADSGEDLYYDADFYYAVKSN